MDKEANKDLVARLKRGDRDAFEEIVSMYEAAIFNLTFRMVNNRDDARDLTQAAFMKAYENMRSFNENHKFFSWLYRIATNECLNFLKKRKSAEQMDRELTSKARGPEENAALSEISEHISRALMALSEDYRVVIVLKHFNDLSYKEISEIIQVPVKTVRSRLFTARQLLRDQLIKQGISL